MAKVLFRDDALQRHRLDHVPTVALDHGVVADSGD